MGAYLSTFAPSMPTYLYATLLAGMYTTPAIYAEVKAVFTNTVPVDAYRGAGRPEATFLLERLVETRSRTIRGIDRIEIRRRNFIPPDAFPYQTPVALQYDSGDYDATLDAALEAADCAGFPQRRREAAARGRLRGIGVSTYIEACGIAPSARGGRARRARGAVRGGECPRASDRQRHGVHRHAQPRPGARDDVRATRLPTSSACHRAGRGRARRHGEDPVRHGHLRQPRRSVGGSAIVKAMDKIIAKGKKIAAHLLEASADDIEFKDGKFTVAGHGQLKALRRISLAAYVPHNYPIEEMEPGLDETAFYDPKNFTFPGGCHICEVEIDPETGAVFTW